jgi:pyruvate/2-oxoglutarate dehydrogenase complex dihydrolipoamide acyltransferase (E2) component
VVAVGIVVLGTIGYGKPPLPTLQKLVKDTGVTQKQAASPAASTTPPTKSAPKPTSRATQTTLPAKAATSPAKPKVHKPASAKKAAAPGVRLLLRAKRTGSWLEVRKQSPSGPVVFSGVLTAGRTLNLTGAGFWVRFGAASNVTVVVNGHPVALNGTIDRVFAAPRG